MFEIKLLRAATYLHRATLRLALHTLNLKDKLALREYNKHLIKARDMRIVATLLKSEANGLEDKAHNRYSGRSREITAAYNYIQNALDDAPKFSQEV